jgi:uncharacterized protein YdaT
MSITINLTKAKDIAKNNLRTERAPVLAALDVQFQRALESNSSTSDIVAKKEELRNITTHSSIVNASDVDSLKTAMNNLIDQIKAE